ncbi:MAG: hypothetical protein KC613_21660, partial [Myxococcales bacterium]|nr:hypothetical protein [Myxococcales bacterium]
DDYCPGIDPGESRDALYAGCLDSCANMAALATIVNNFGGNCAQVVPTVSTASADFAASCEGGGDAPSTEDIQAMFAATCSGCHVGGASQGGLNLDDHEASTVGVDAIGAAMPLVDAGDHMNSYMYHKLAGTHADVGGGGSTMPIGRAAWTADELADYAAWIDSLPTE